MKLQGLAVIFVLIILPISIVLSEYVQIQIDTLNLQTQYDSQLLSATYDTVVAFQKNTVNSWSSNIADSKMRDIDAASTVFLTSIANNFKMAGNSKNAIKEYIPAIVYTLYDGYYIYTPFYNEITGTDAENGTYNNNERIFGLKPYIYYSREYKDYPKQGDDFVITYSLDNYITIQGKVNDKYVNDSGYIIDINQCKEDGTKYYGAEIKEGFSDKVYEYIDSKKNYRCVKINGAKFYKEDNNDAFTYVSTEHVKVPKPENNKYFDVNYSPAREFYKKSYKFTKKVIEDYSLDRLTSQDGVGYNSNEQSNYNIFDINNVEYYNSGFNQERRAVIKYAIEKNLTTSIANFSKISNTKNVNFQMPKLSEDEWDKIINNVSVITFLQGINMGNRQYNGYAIVPNNKNEELVSEDSIYIKNNNFYYRVNDKTLINAELSSPQGIFNMNFERKTIYNYDPETGENLGSNYFYPNEDLASYGSIVNQRDITPLIKSNGTPKSIYEYLDEIKDKRNGPQIASLYYTALGRERWGMNRINNPFLKDN